MTFFELKRQDIVLTVPSRGVYKEGYISGAHTPGRVMQVKSGVQPVGGRLTWEPYDRAASGNRPKGALVVLLADTLQGKTKDDAYADGERCFLYACQPGEEYNLRVAEAGTGTGDSQAIGDAYIIEDGTGLLIPSEGTPQSEPFMCLEDLPDVVAAGSFVLVEFTGY